MALLYAVCLKSLHCDAQDKLQEYERQVSELKAKLQTVNREKCAVESQLQRSMSEERMRSADKVCAVVLPLSIELKVEEPLLEPGRGAAPMLVHWRLL